MKAALGCVIAVTACAAPHASIAGYRADVARPTEILVLATEHLREVAECLVPDALSELIDRLARWKPDLIAVESLPATTLEAIATRSDDFATDLREGFGQRSLDAAAAVGITADAARKELAAGATAEREVLLLLAAHEYPSAVLHWNRLAADARGRIPAELAAKLDESSRSANEIDRIAVPLAERLGHDRIALVDDFSGEEVYARRFEELAREVAANPAVKQVANAPLYVETKQRLHAACRDPHALAEHYAWLNSPDYASRDVALQWGIWFRTHFASGLDRARYAGWEARNLGIAANIRKESSLYPGKRVLVIYGAAHKPFLDAYLAQMLDVRVVQLAELPR